MASAFLVALSALVWHAAPTVHVDPKSKVTVSGFSYGGDMAVQAHVAFSKTIKGVCVVCGAHACFVLWQATLPPCVQLRAPDVWLRQPARLLRRATLYPRENCVERIF